MLLPNLADAGAWPRGKYQGYFDLSFFSYDGQTPNKHVYGEFGVTDQITLTLDGIYQEEIGGLTGIIGLVYALPEGTLPFQLSIGGGVGRALYFYEVTEDVFEFRGGRRIQIAQTITQTITTQNAAQLSLHLGFSTLKTWSTADLRYLTFQSTGSYLAKLDLTHGYHVSDRLNAMVQVQIGQASEFNYLNLAPAIEWSFTPNIAMVLGGVYDTKGDSHAVRLGAVVRF
ncbi:hypothetical protein [Algirhabdus cladophorae]|uniref:hypothetical protein n=1 Tax=Algirhabdus cladophorae TaxID=3377108 RepID=UPI003B8465C3